VLKTRSVAAGLLLALSLAPAAHAAGEPIMPLKDVQKGMHCTASSVIQGTTISTFDADVVDVIAGDPASRQPYILINVSGPAVDATGIGPGFSGSPVRCPDADGVMRIAGAISEGIGAYGNKQVLATPIEDVLSEPVDPPPGIRYRPAVMRAAHPLATPLSIGGLSPAVAATLQKAAVKAGRVVFAAPPAPLQTDFPVQQLVPGAAFSTGLASGDITAGAIGTVTYVDGTSVWGFGHPLDSVGRRSLYLQDAYVYSVVNNPIASADLSTYKYAAIGHTVGELTNDGISGVAGRLGALPPQFPLKVTATDLDTKEQLQANMGIADETGIGLPTGTSSLAQVGSIAVAQLSYEIIDGAPADQSGSMCINIAIAETRKPLSVCNSYVGGGGGEQTVGGGPLVADFTSAISTLDAYNFGPLHIKSVDVDIKLSRSLRQAFLFGAIGPQVVRRGHDYRFRLRARKVNGPRLSRHVRVHVPKGMAPGPRYLTFTGTSADISSSPLDALSLSLDDLLGGLDEGDTGEDDSGPKTIGALRAAIAGIHREDGVTASFRPLASSGDSLLPPEGRERIAQTERPVMRAPDLRFSGQTKALVLVR